MLAASIVRWPESRRSFIKPSGLDRFRPLERSPLRVLTTAYMWATEVKAIALLHRLGAEDAKDWLFHRDSE